MTTTPPGTPAPHRDGGRGLVGSFLDSAFEMTAASRAYLASERGRRLRRSVAAAVIVGAPLASELPFIRKTFVARVLRRAALATLVVKGAEWLRDWEPALEPRMAGPAGSAGPHRERME